MQTAAGTPQANVLRIGRVAKVYAEKHVVDIVFLDDGGFASGVPVSTQWGSQEHGFHYMPRVDIPSDGQWGVELSNTNDTLALIGYFSGQPYVVGMAFPVGGMPLPLDVLKIQTVVGSYLEMDAGGTVTVVASETRRGGSGGVTGVSAVLSAPSNFIDLTTSKARVFMGAGGVFEATCVNGNKFSMNAGGDIEITSGGGAVINMGADGVINFNPSDPNAPV